MNLEKATSTNTEAGLAGWISSNDVTLFTMVLVVIVALFLHGKLIRGQDENKVLSSANESLNENLGLATNERNALNAQLQVRDRDLDQTRQQLQLSQAQRDQLNQDMLAAMKEINDLSQSISTMTQETVTLRQEKTKLFERGTNLEKTITTLSTDKTNLADEKKTLNEQMADLATKLENRLKALESLEAQRERLQAQADRLAAINDTLELKLSDSGAKITALAAKAGETEAEYQKRVADLEKTAGDQAKRAEDYLAKLRRAADLFQGLKKSNASLEQKLQGAEQRYQRQLTLETTVNRKLVGINGKLKRVALLFDASGSMKQKDDDASGDRWQDAQAIASTWLGHLDLDECVLIVFSSDVRTFPSDGTMANIQGPDGEANRAQLMAQLKSVEPEGWTNTLEALKKAYSYEGLDTILLFSDGAPTFANSGRFDPNVAAQIYALCRRNPHVPVNTVGLGNYFDQNLSTFLRTVASVSGGTFRGR